MLVFFVLSAFLIYRWANERYGKPAAFIATLFFSFSPTVIANSRFVTTDVPALFGVLLGTYFFIKFLRKPTKETFLFASLAFGVAQLTKFSAVILAPYFVILAIIYALIQNKKLLSIFYSLFPTFLIFIVGIILIVWPVYGLHTMNYPPEKQKIDTTEHLRSYGNRLFADPVVWASDKPVIRPLAHYATGILMVNQRSIGGNTTFFLGEVRNYAWKKYFPVVYAIKEPLAFWVIVISVFMYLGTKFKIPNSKFKILSLRSWIKNYFTEFSMLLWIAIYWYLSIRANLNIGVRHLLPTYGFVFILLAGQLTKIIRNSKLEITNYKTKIKVIPILIFVLLGWYVTENIRVYPHYLTYFNQLAGGPSGGHRYVVDSNLDWGQDLKRLTTWVEKNSVDKIYLDYFGWADPSYYLKGKSVWINSEKYRSAKDFLAENPDGGYITVSASFYMGSREKPEKSYAWLDAYKPIAVIGNSIFVWEIRP